MATALLKRTHEASYQPGGVDGQEGLHLRGPSWEKAALAAPARPPLPAAEEEETVEEKEAEAEEAEEEASGQLLMLSDDLFRAILTDVDCVVSTVTVELLKLLRAVCKDLRNQCNRVSSDIYRALEACAAKYIDYFPEWASMLGLTKVAHMEMKDYVPIYWKQRLVPQVQIYVTTYRRARDNITSVSESEERRNLDGTWAAVGLQRSLVETQRQQEKDDDERMAQLRDPSRTNELLYHLLVNRRCRFRFRTRELHHLCLGSVAKWFGGFGWKLDECAALLFSHRCANLMDTGSTWMAAEPCPALTLRERLLSVHAAMLRKIDDGQEEAVLPLLRGAFGAGWTAATRVLSHHVMSNASIGYQYTDNHDATPASVHASGEFASGEFAHLAHPANNDLNQGRFAHRRDLELLGREFGALRERLRREISARCRQSETVKIFERKIRACLMWRLQEKME